jgi:class 3 adenylate cyclase
LRYPEALRRHLDSNVREPGNRRRLRRQLVDDITQGGIDPSCVMITTLFADLEGSSSLSRRLSTARYFSLGRRLVRAADRSIVDSGGGTPAIGDDRRR